MTSAPHTLHRAAVGRTLGRVPSLTMTEAQDRASLLHVEHYRLELDLSGADDPERTTFRSHSTIRFGCRRPGATTFAEVRPEQLERAELNGRPVGPVEDGRLLLTDLAADNTLQVVATMAYSNDGEGMHRSIDPADGQAYLYLMAFLDAAPRAFGCFDQPDLKARYDVTVRVPEGWSVLGNGRAKQLAPGRFRLATTPPLSTYFVTVVAGPYHSVTGEHDGIRLGVHARASLAEQLDQQAPELLDLTGRAFDEYHRLFGIRYVFGDYHQAFVPDFNAGAMENPGCITLRDSMVFRAEPTAAERTQRAVTMVHELAHQWFGNLTTMRWWDDLWLNESFATYMAYRVCAELDVPGAGLVSALRQKWPGLLADQRSSTHPVAAQETPDTLAALNNFDGVSYSKGAAVLKQLAARLGDDVFIGGVVRHLRDHEFGNATLADLLRAWSEAGAVDLADWAAQWLRTSGPDTLVATRRPGLVRISRATDLRHRADREHTFRVHHVGAGADTVELGADPVDIRTDAEAVIVDAGDDTWARVRLDERTVASLPQVLPRLDDPLTRSVVWNATRQAVDDAVLDPEAMTALLAAALPAEREEIVVSSVLDWAAKDLAGRYLPEAVAGPPIADLVRTCFTGAAGRPGLRQALARLVAVTSYEAELLSDWLADRGPADVRVDPELRWRALGRLVVLGAAGRAEIETEFARDRSTAGQVAAARCRSLIPEPAAKAEAWRLLSADAQVGNHTLYATAEGFWHPSQHELTAPYVPRFFTEMPATDRLRSGWVVALSVAFAYPRYAVTAETVRLAEELLGDGAAGLSAGVRRSISDGTDDLRRAVAVRDRWPVSRTARR